MDPESQRREEREELLGDHDEYSERKAASRQAPAKRHSLLFMLALVAISILALVGFTIPFWSHQLDGDMTGDDQQGKPPATGSAGSSGSTPAAPSHTAPPPLIPPNEDFDLKRTGFVVSATPQVREYVFNITRQWGAPDGVNKSMILVNGQSPGPLIEANIGDTIRVVVHNSMPEDRTTIHWHGIDQRDSVWMDGVAGVTQCGIPPGESFTYEFSVPNQRGTFWYHAHVSVQYTDGLYGPLIIHDPDEKIPQVDDDKIIFLGDWYHMDGRAVVSQYLSKSPSWNPGMPGTEPYPDNILINGRHVFNCTKDPKLLQPDCRGGKLYNARVKSQTTSRLRLISHSSNTPFWFTVDGHSLEIVEMDGVEVRPVATTRVFLNPGQRYSVLLRANQTAGNYRMRAVATCAMLDRRPGSALSTVENRGTAILSYDDVDADAPPFGRVWNLKADTNPGIGREPWEERCRDLPFNATRPVRELDAYQVGERNQHYVFFKFVDDKAGVTRTSINDTIFSSLEGTASVWLASQQNTTAANMDSANPNYVFMPQQHVLVSRDEGKAAQVAISAGNMMGHPWHLHGQQFQIVGWGRGEFGASTTTTTWNFANPQRRDTVTVPGHSHVVIRFLADNPGVWALHCHIQWHAEGGMFTQTAQRLTKLQEMIGGLGAKGENSLREKFCSAPSESK